MKKIVYNQAGFSLTSAIVAAGVLGIVAVGLINLQKNMSFIQQQGAGVQSVAALTQEVRMMLQNPDSCTVSLAGNIDQSGAPQNPVLFKKQEVSSADSGLPISLFTPSQDGLTREEEKFHSSLSRGDLVIKDISLVMTNGAVSNYAQSDFHKEIGYVRVLVEKKVGNKKREVLLNPPEGFPVAVTMKTDSAGVTTILGCNLHKKTAELKRASAKIVITLRDYSGHHEQCNGYFSIEDGGYKTRDYSNGRTSGEMNDTKCYSQIRNRDLTSEAYQAAGIHILSIIWADDYNAEVIYVE